MRDKTAGKSVEVVINEARKTESDNYFTSNIRALEGVSGVGNFRESLGLAPTFYSGF